MYIKSDSKKGWKKYNSVLRASGLYYYKNKMSRLSKDLVCLSTFDVNQVYHGIGWKKKYKAPTDYCFAIKHPFLQHPSKSAKYVKYVCVEGKQAFHKWMSAIRIVIYGRQLLQNYESALVGAVTKGSETPTEDSESGISDSASSCCDVAQGPPCSGIIIRKMPKLPLTATTTRLLTCFVETTETSVAAATATSAIKAAPITTSATTAATGITAPKVPLVEIRKKPVKTVKFADFPDHIPQPCQTLSLVSLPSKIPSEIEDPNDEDILSVVPPPPPELQSPPSTAYLSDLRRTGSRKWQILRELDTAAIGKMVAEYYKPKNLYKDTNSLSTNNNKPVSVTCSSPPPLSSHVSINSVIMANLVSPKKGSPPPPPPRSKRTHLTTT